MAYRLKRGESIPEGIRRIVHEEADSAIGELSHRTGKQRDEGIHEARKSVKKIRGLLRLVRPELGRVYRAENRRLGDVGRKLSEIRDATAVIEVFDGLLGKHKDGLQKNALASIRKGLQTRKREMEQHAGVGDAVKRATAALRTIQKRVDGWPLKKDGFQALAQGLEERYRGGRRAMGAAQKNGTPENYHEWRKRVKDHWYHVRLLESLWTEVMQAHERSLHDLETWLGDDHNLVVLCATLQEEPAQYGDEEAVQLFLTLAAKEQQELRSKALSLGERVYERKPRRFEQDTEKLWDAWQQEPDGMKEEEKEQRQTPKKQPARAGSAKPKKAAAA
ncbi:MAG TPA: CHAD domain-containing protein [Bryobacteraceae bacterium]|jgi:CHAD domain-containing protein|nr:CHAD domain-containing protein [Bryobacteraceae bacterium]